MQGAAWSNECLHLKLNFQLYIQIADLPGHIAHSQESPQQKEIFLPALSPSTIQ